ncbi:MAG: hypothetical protein WAM69_01505 [Candidatus Sulfotelmatobacter sp.]
MRNFVRLVALLVFATATWAQSPEPSALPQTARQALIEMFFSKAPGTFVKHLPAATLSALERAGALATLQQYSALASQFHTKDQTFQTFETGPILLAAENSQSGQKFELAVENDSLRGDEDDIEVSFHTYKEKQLQRSGVLPRMTFAMKMESGVWKLNEILVTVRLQLADPDFLKSITEGMMKARSAAAAHMLSPSLTSTGTFGTAAPVLAAMRSILTAETAYANTYRAVGYTCTLSDLDGFGGGEPNEHQAMLIASGLAAGRKYGYVFTLSACAGNPATSFHLVATPVMAPFGGNSLGRRTYCSDQSGAIRSSLDGSPASCLAGGLPAQ